MDTQPKDSLLSIPETLPEQKSKKKVKMKKVFISGLKNKYTSGDIVSCKINIVRVFDKDEIKSIDVSLIKTKTIRVKTGVLIYIAPITFADGSSSLASWVPEYKIKKIDTVIGRDLTDISLRENQYNKNPKFKIPPDESNSSNCGCNPLIQDGDVDYLRQEISYRISVKIKYINKKGHEKVIEESRSFINKNIIKDSTPRYMHVFEENNFSLMYKSNTSEFSPGESVKLDIVLINKETKKSSLDCVIGDLFSSDFKLKKSLKSLKSIENKSLPKEEEYDYMKEFIDSGKCASIIFTMPKDMYGEKDRAVCVGFKLNNKYTIQDTIKACLGSNIIKNLAYDVLNENEVLDDEEEQYIEARDPFCGFPDVPLGKKAMDSYIKEENERKKENELIRHRNMRRKKRDENENKEEKKVEVEENENKEEEENENYFVPILDNKDIPIFYRSLLRINEIRKSIIR